MSRPVVSRLMQKEEFVVLTEQIAGSKDRWLERLHDLTAIDKPTLLKYSTGERGISNTHALFIRQMYLLQKAYPDLASDINVMMRKPVDEGTVTPSYAEVQEKVALTAEVKRLKGVIGKIGHITQHEEK